MCIRRLSGDTTERGGRSRGGQIGTGAGPLGATDLRGEFNRVLSDCSPPAYSRLAAREDPGPNLRLTWLSHWPPREGTRPKGAGVCDCRPRAFTRAWGGTEQVRPAMIVPPRPPWRGWGADAVALGASGVAGLPFPGRGNVDVCRAAAWHTPARSVWPRRNSLMEMRRSAFITP